MNEPSLEFACPVCGDAMMIPDSLRGRELQCPHEGCGALFQTPPLEAPPAPENEAPAAPAPAGTKKRQPQMPKGPGLKRKGPGPATTPKPPPTRTEKPKPADTGAPPAAPAMPPVRHQMGTGTKISYVVGILAVIGMVIYNKVKKAEAAARPPAPAPHAQPAAPRPPAAKPPVAPTEIVVPPPKPATAAKGRNKEMTEEERNRLNESFAKLDDEKHQEQKENFAKRLARAKTGSKTAQLDVGTMYMKGTGVTPDRKLAREWLDKSAAQNHLEAFLALGELEAMEGDTAKAVKQYVHAGDMAVPDFQKGESRAKEIVAKALEQLSVLGAHAERDKLAGATTERKMPEPKTAETPAPPPPATPLIDPPLPVPPSPVPPVPDPPAPPTPEEPVLIPPDPPAATPVTPPAPVPETPSDPPVIPAP